MAPSHLPVALQLVRDGTALPTKEVEGDEGPTTVALLEGVAAGSSVCGLRILLLDESGQPAAQEVVGRVTLSWRSGNKKVTWSSAALTAAQGIKLPPCKVRPLENCWACRLPEVAG